MCNCKKQQLTDNDYIQIALDELGTAIRDNSRDEKIEIGKRIENGTWDDRASD